MLMLHYNRIGVSEGVHVNNTSASHECIISRYWYFYIKGLSFNNLSVIVAMMY